MSPATATATEGGDRPLKLYCHDARAAIATRPARELAPAIAARTATLRAGPGQARRTARFTLIDPVHGGHWSEWPTVTIHGDDAATLGTEARTDAPGALADVVAAAIAACQRTRSREPNPGRMDDAQG